MPEKQLLIPNRFPLLTPQGHLERAFFWLNSENEIGIFYAALELRFAFEQLVIKHGFSSTNFTKTFEKLNFKPRYLYEKLKEENIEKIDITKSYRFFLQNEGGGTEIDFGYFLPIQEELFTMYGMLDNLLHSQWAIPINSPNKNWKKKNTENLMFFANELIPHANPDNSLDYINLPSIKFIEMDNASIKLLLLNYWRQT